MDALIFLGSFAGYAFVGGGIGMATYITHPQRCKHIKAFGESECTHGVGEAPVLAGFFWPLALPAVGGMLTANYLSKLPSLREAKEQRKVRAHLRRMDELKAQEKLSRQKTEQSVALTSFLEENGIHAQVPGLTGFDLGELSK